MSLLRNNKELQFGALSYMANQVQVQRNEEEEHYFMVLARAVIKESPFGGK